MSQVSHGLFDRENTRQCNPNSWRSRHASRRWPSRWNPHGLRPSQGPCLFGSRVQLLRGLRPARETETMGRGLLPQSYKKKRRSLEDFRKRTSEITFGRRVRCPLENRPVHRFPPRARICGNADPFWPSILANEHCSEKRPKTASLQDPALATERIGHGFFGKS